jgi:hypothetical protein
MTEIRTRDEALAAIDHALAQWLDGAAAVLTEAMAAASGAAATAEAQVSRRAQRVAVLEAQLRSLPSDSPARAQIQRELGRAHESLRAGRDAARRISNVASQIAILLRTQSQVAGAQVTAARADLARRVKELGAYRAAGGGSAAVVTAAAGALGGLAIAVTGATSAAARAALGATAEAPAEGGAAWLATGGLSDFDIAEADLADNPVTGSFGRGGLGRADYRWALTTWDQVVRPGLDRGMTRNDFAARDAARDAPPLRRTADVYDMFLGSDPIRVERRPDGTLDVINGRRRIEIAADLGLTTLPAVLAGP